MKRYVSVFALYARSAVGKLIAILLLLTAAESALFHFSLQDMLLLARGDPNQGLRFEDVLIEGRLALVFFAAAVLLTAALCVRGSCFGSREGCTLRRLRISEKGVFCMQWLFSSLAYFTLWAWQALLIAAFAAYYGHEVGAKFFNPQTLFLAAYRSDFFHSLMPMSNIVRWLRNLIIVASLGACCARLCWLRRRDRRVSLCIMFALAACYPLFVSEMPSFGLDALLAAIVGIIGAYCADNALREEVRDEEA